MHNTRTGYNLPLLFLACGILLFGSGCAGKVETRVGGTAETVFSVSEVEEQAPEEIVELPELPSDDGVPLSLAERIALHSTGELDVFLTAEQKKQVELHFKYYLHKNRAGFERYLQRAEGYLPYVRQVFREMGVPEEIAGLAIVESGFNPNAVSRAGATGMWQFMRYTGKRYGLEQNYWLDERRDPFKSSVAAANYLLQLHEYFGDWHLAIAAYNAGEGKIQRAMQSTGADNFFELCRLNGNIRESKLRLKLETQQYVPRFLAVAKIMRNLELLGFEAPDPQKSYKVAAVKVGPGADLGALSRNAGIRYEQFRAMNPAYRQSISPVTGSSTAYVPVEYAPQAVAWLSRPEARSFAGWQQYKVRKGDSLHAIGQRYGVTVSVLRQANNLKGNTLRQGAILMVPGGKGSSVAASGQNSKNTASRTAGKSSGKSASQTSGKTLAQGSGKTSGGNSIHTVRRGENLYQIAQQYGLSLSSLQAANNLAASDSFLLVGQKLVIPGGKGGSVAAATKGKVVHVVQKGDTLYGLAQKNKISLDELVRVNGLRRNKPLVPGQQLLIP